MKNVNIWDRQTGKTTKILQSVHELKGEHYAIMWRV